MKKGFTKVQTVTVIIVLLVIGLCMFKAVDPVEKSAKTKDDATLQLMSSIKDAKLMPSGDSWIKDAAANSEVKIPDPLKNMDLEKIFLHKETSSGMIIYTKLSARANYSRCDKSMPLAWAVYSTNDDHTGIVCTESNSIPSVGNQVYLP